MADMTATFEMMPDAEDFLDAPDIKPEYIVSGPVNIVVELKSGETFYPQEIRERIVRCRDCANAYPLSRRMRELYPGMLDCSRFAQWDDYNDCQGFCLVEPNGFCAWGEERESYGRVCPESAS